MIHFTRLWLLLVCVVLAGPAVAQQAPGPMVSGTFSALSFEEFARAVEAQTPARFFFDPAALDSVKITLQVQNQPLKDVLALVGQHTRLHFALDSLNHVYVTVGAALPLSLPDAFFEPRSFVLVTAAPTAAESVPGAAPAKTRGSVSELKVYEIGRGEAAGGKATLAGHIRELKSGEPVIGATIYSEASKIGTSTDQFGFFSLTLPTGRHELRVRGIGIKNTRRQVQLRANGSLEIEVEEDITTLKEVVIEGEKDKNVSGMQMGLEKLDIRTMKQVPTAFGETDILRVVLTLPGVKSVGEGSTGLNVRGGSADQNLILFNNATVYNPSHLFGFFSAFNPDIIKSVELYKSAIPAKYGGRLSSVLDITTRDGNKKKLSGSAGIGPLTSRLTLEGPIIKDKSSFIISGRSSYSDWILHLLPSESFKQSSAGFYDVSAHISHEINENNTIYATGYLSNDRFQLASDTAYRYVNRSGSLKWRHNFSNKLYGVLSGSYSHYGYDVTSELNPSTASQLRYRINQGTAQADFSFFPNTRHTIDFGASTLLYNVAPGSLRPEGAESLVVPKLLDDERALESALYVSDRIDLSSRLSVSVGLRYSFFNALGPRQVYQYAPGLSKSESTIRDTVTYAKNQVLATYHGPEYRLSARFALSDNSSVKASYNRTRQYIHMLSNTASMSPTDIWKLSDSNIRPQVGDQYSIGFYRNFKSNTIETSVETYYKSMHDFVDYKSGATLLLNRHIETDIVNAEGKAYGVEVMVKKLTGKINGWVSYTYSRSLVQVNIATTSDMINGGNFYPSNFDKPHDVTLISNYRFSRRISTSLNFTYSTGRPITLPLVKYYIGTSTRVYYSERNAYRVPDYYRADLAMNLEGNHKVHKPFHSSWTVGVYNLTGRHNPYSIYFKSVNGQIKGYKLSIFAQPIPTVTYNIKF
ncbi:TonB-dependent receptor [Hymenobacter chitinivorans]|uniref:Outer membrane receptor protein involved in Fe transport n=1 Tax=Hymenobacter chitinivorans DSM 11115 TaxID=1121954 RepID=A0A2M9B5H1_9BACT|nr:TonB-dependent receptor [Hymenobacter chitinivorans]PJJ53194.1 outer membrane receptor protein involved in Fe transport [Hymenobacter chitinivorans DSM 11115]